MLTLISSLTGSRLKWLVPMLALGLVVFSFASVSHAQDVVVTPEVVVAEVVAEVTEAAPTIDPEQEAAVLGKGGMPYLMLTTNNLWMMICAALVFIMHLGFACVESGLCRSKNAVNILTKNVMVVCIGILMYWVVGFALMYPGFTAGEYNWIGFSSGTMNTLLFDPSSADTSFGYYGGAYTFWTDFLFQAMFAATAATIVSGAVAERIKLAPFLIFTVLFVGFLYPFVGSWKWGMGWLNDLGFHDFAGSTLVHSVGGWGALAGVILLGPRLGKYRSDGGVNPIPGHSMPLAAIGVFLLWLGWFGFNGGSVLSADPAGVSFVLVTTTLAGAVGAIAALFTSWVVIGKPDLSMALNGILAGLVGITAGADVINPVAAVIVGLIAGVIVVLSVLFLDKLKLDDPVGAISVHLVCGIWGTLAVGIFGTGKSFLPQVYGVVAYGVVAFIFALVVFGVLKAVMGIRVSEAEEIEGLDIGEHGMEAYPGFSTVTVGAEGSSSISPSGKRSMA